MMTNLSQKFGGGGESAPPSFSLAIDVHSPLSLPCFWPPPPQHRQPRVDQPSQQTYLLIGNSDNHHQLPLLLLHRRFLILQQPTPAINSSTSISTILTSNLPTLATKQHSLAQVIFLLSFSLLQSAIACKTRICFV